MVEDVRDSGCAGWVGPWCLLLVVPLSACATKEVEGNGFDGPVGTATQSATSGDVPEDDGSSSEGGVGGSSGESSGEPGSGESGFVDDCGAGTCAQRVPNGWFGPVLRWDAAPDAKAAPPECEGDWPDSALTLKAGFHDPGPAVCECSCGLNVSNVCAAFLYGYEGTAACGGVNDFFVSLGSAEDCEAVPLDEGSVLTYAATAGTANCSVESTDELPEIPWELEVSGCRGAAWGPACAEGRACLPELPAGFSNRLCVFAEGDHVCPPGDYSVKETLYSGADDSRWCTACECGSPTGVTCSGTFEYYDDEDCSGTVLASAPQASTCTDVAGMQSLRLVPEETGSCDVSVAPSPMGTVVPTDPMTYCCTAAD